MYVRKGFDFLLLVLAILVALALFSFLKGLISGDPARSALPAWVALDSHGRAALVTDAGPFSADEKGAEADFDRAERGAEKGEARHEQRAAEAGQLSPEERAADIAKRERELDPN